MIVVSSRCHPGICMEAWRKSTKNLEQDSRCSGQDSNSGPSDCESDVLPIEPTCTVTFKPCISHNHVIVIYMKLYSLTIELSDIWGVLHLSSWWKELHTQQWVVCGHRELLFTRNSAGIWLLLIISEKTRADFLAVRLRLGSLKSTWWRPKLSLEKKELHKTARKLLNDVL
jgi:hypothetical protein